MVKNTAPQANNFVQKRTTAAANHNARPASPPPKKLPAPIPNIDLKSKAIVKDSSSNDSNKIKRKGRPPASPKERSPVKPKAITPPKAQMLPRVGGAPMNRDTEMRRTVHFESPEKQQIDFTSKLNKAVPTVPPSRTPEFGDPSKARDTIKVPLPKVVNSKGHQMMPTRSAPPPPKIQAQLLKIKIFCDIAPEEVRMRIADSSVQEIVDLKTSNQGFPLPWENVKPVSKTAAEKPIPPKFIPVKPNILPQVQKPVVEQQEGSPKYNKKQSAVSTLKTSLVEPPPEPAVREPPTMNLQDIIGVEEAKAQAQQVQATLPQTLSSGSADVQQSQDSQGVNAIDLSQDDGGQQQQYQEQNNYFNHIDPNVIQRETQMMYHQQMTPRYVAENYQTMLSPQYHPIATSYHQGSNEQFGLQRETSFIGQRPIQFAQPIFFTPPTPVQFQTPQPPLTPVVAPPVVEQPQMMTLADFTKYQAKQEEDMKLLRDAMQSRCDQELQFKSLIQETLCYQTRLITPFLVQLQSIIQENQRIVASGEDTVMSDAFIEESKVDLAQHKKFIDTHHKIKLKPYIDAWKTLNTIASPIPLAQLLAFFDQKRFTFSHELLTPMLTIAGATEYLDHTFRVFNDPILGAYIDITLQHINSIQSSDIQSLHYLMYTILSCINLIQVKLACYPMLPEMI